MTLADAMREVLDDMSMEYRVDDLPEGTGTAFGIALPSGEVGMYLQARESAEQFSIICEVGKRGGAAARDISLLCSIATDNCCIGAFYPSSTDDAIEFKCGFGLGIMPNGLYGAAPLPPSDRLKRMIFDALITTASTVDAWLPAFNSLLSGEATTAEQAESCSWRLNKSSLVGFEVNGREYDYGGGDMDIVTLGGEEE